MEKYSAKKILITGTSKGIGKFLAEYYMEKGFVVIGCSRSKGVINHKNHYHYELDISNEAKVKEMIDILE